MPRGGNIAARVALKREKEEAKREKNAAASLFAAVSRSHTSPLNLSDPHASTDCLDIPCTPVAPTTAAAAEQFETPAAPFIEEAGAVELPPTAVADVVQDLPTRARKSTEIMNVGEFPTNFKRKKVTEVAASTDTLGNAIYDEKLLVEGIQQLREGCPGCGKHTPIAFQESVRRGLGGHLKFTCTNKKCLHETKINKSKMMPGLSAAGKPCAPKAVNTARGVAAFMAAGIAESNANEFLLGMDMPPLNTNVWAAHGETFAAATKTNLDRLILENIEKEKAATLLYEGESCLTSDGKVKIKVMTDGSWQKRYGRNSLYGIGAMYGYYTGLVLFADDRCARCQVCMTAASRGAELPANHKEICTNTWRKGESASLMERDIALEGVNFLFAHNCIVEVLICDGDTKTVQYIKEKGPQQVADVINVWLDLNHVEKNVGKKLRELGVGLSEEEAKALQISFCRAVKESRKKNPAKGVRPGSEEERRCVECLQEEIRTAPGHLFNKDGHVGCKEDCPMKAANTAIYNPSHIPHNLHKWIHPGNDDVKYKAVVQVFVEYSSFDMCAKLIYDCTSNLCESLNILTWDKMGKRRLKPTSGSAHMRMAQLQRQQGQGAATQYVNETMGIGTSSPETVKRWLKKDNKRKR
jgi:hypothetical protein